MKIRSDFVTNSSSTSYGEVVIDNLVLLEILARYKEMGTFAGGSNISIGSFYDKGGNYPDVVYGEMAVTDPDISTITPAFHTFCAHEWDTPSSLDEVIEEIIAVMEDNYDFSDESVKALFNQLKEELIQREDEILKAFKTVKWYSRQVLYSGRFGCWEFKYDQENGEYYHNEETGCLDF